VPLDAEAKDCLKAIGVDTPVPPEAPEWLAATKRDPNFKLSVRASGKTIDPGRWTR